MHSHPYFAEGLMNFPQEKVNWGVFVTRWSSHKNCSGTWNACEKLVIPILEVMYTNGIMESPLPQNPFCD